MNREQRRAANKIGRGMMKMPASKFVNITNEAKMRFAGRDFKYKLADLFFRSNHYTAQVFFAERMILETTMDKIMIRRNDAEPIRDWHVLQEIKNEICGENALAIQVFPPQSELVDAANMYWLFVKTGSWKPN
ncbi:MAG: DUF7694 domain-containing protein [Pseudobdellovibrionaceae bacterium]